MKNYCFPLMIVILINSNYPFALVIEERAARGQDCLKDLSKCDLQNNNDSIIDVTHFLYKNGKEKNQGHDFIGGSFVIEDPGYKIFDKLKGYVRSKYGDKLCNEVIITLQSAYPRKSTHFNSLYLYNGKAKKTFLGGISKTDCEYAHFGIDVGKNKLPMDGMSHILFGKVGTIDERDLIFLKMESAGLSGFDAVYHGVDLIKTTAARLLPNILKGIKTRLGLIKVDLKSLEKEFNDLLDETSLDEGANALTIYRKERIPGEYIAYFLALLLESKQGKIDEEFKKAKELIKAYGVSEIIATLSNVIEKKDVSIDVKNKIQEFLSKLKSRYATDYFMRFGNEIIVRPIDWK